MSRGQVMSRENHAERSLPSSHYPTPSSSSQATLRLFLSGGSQRVSERPVTQASHASLKQFFQLLSAWKGKSKVSPGQIPPFGVGGARRAGKICCVESVTDFSACHTRWDGCHLPPQPSAPQGVTPWPGPIDGGPTAATRAGMGSQDPCSGTSLAAAPRSATRKQVNKQTHLQAQSCLSGQRRGQM